MEKVTCSNCGKENPAHYKYCFECGYEMPKPTAPEMEEAPQVKVKSKGKLNDRMIFGVTFSVVFCICFFAVQHFFFGSASVDKNLMKEASKLNESCPMMVDSETRLDNAVASPNKTFQYYYTLVNIEISQVNPAEGKKILEPQITNLVKTNPEMKAMRDIGVTFKYNYRDKNGIFIFDIIVGPNKYMD
jgi:hypothetical protein